MAYKEASRPRATSIISVVTRVQSVFSDLELQQAREIEYGFGRSGSDEELAKLEKLYSDAGALCDKFLNGQLCESCLVSKLDAMNLQTYTVEIKTFIN